MSLLLYAFSNQWGTNISHRTLLELQKSLSGADFKLIYGHPKAFFNKHIKSFCSPALSREGDRGRVIIGLGDFYGNVSKIRLETIAHNIYGENSISPFSPINLEISLPSLDHLDTKIFTVSEHMGKYNCNWIAYSTELLIREHSPDTCQLFFHLPKKMPSTTAAIQILELLQNNSLI